MTDLMVRCSLESENYERILAEALALPRSSYS
jgi:hypothetical protein